MLVDELRAIVGSRHVLTGDLTAAHVTDWTGPRGRLGRMTFRMRDSVFPGDRMAFSATVTGVERDDAGWCRHTLAYRDLKTGALVVETSPVEG